MKLVYQGLTPNGLSARPIAGPAMRTSFGQDVEPESLSARPREDLHRAMRKYETFHAKAPLRAVELGHDLPHSWVCVGQAISTMYRTDKWKADGDDEDYKHVHDPVENKEYEFGQGVLVYEPANESTQSVKQNGRQRVRANEGLKQQKLPIDAPDALTLLGYCLGLFIQRFDDGEIYEVNPRGCYLFCSPGGDMLALYSPSRQPDGSEGFLCAMAGGKLRVLKEGIDG